MLDVLGAGQPWEVPDEWVGGVRGQLRAWADDAGALRPGVFPEFVVGTPAAVWFLHQVAPLLGGWIPVLRGEYADLAAVLTRDFHRAPVRLGGDGYVVRVAAGDWPLLAVGGARGFNEEGRRQALQLSRDVVSLFVDAPPLAARARALTSAFDRVLGDREATRMHVQADYETIVQFWQTAVLSDAERAVLPELAGPAAALQYSLEALREAQAELSAVVADDEAVEFPQLLARLIRATGLKSQPPTVGQVLGIAGWDVEHALAELRDRFDPQVWLRRNTEWLERAVAQGQRMPARSWAAAATRVSVHLAGVLENGPWPEPEVPDLSAFFRILDGDSDSAAGTAGQPAAATPIPLAWASPTTDATDVHEVSDGGVPEPAVGAVDGAEVDDVRHSADAVSEPTDDVRQSPDAVSEPADDVPTPAHDGTAALATGPRSEGEELAAAGNDIGALAELEALVGLETVKESVRRMVAEIKTNQRRKEFGLPTQERARHMVFVGKPGTAKTTIARLLGRIYKELGVLEKGHVVEVDRSDLVGSAVGSTAPMTAAKFREALGGVLFVDEAYTLVPENIPGDFGHEAVATLLKMMEDYRDEVVVIMAGYHREIQRLMESNTGLASRFPKLLAFSEYDTDQLVAIFELQARQKGMIFTDEVMKVVRRIIPPAPRGHNFGNGRFIRNVLEEAISNQSTRLALRDPDTLTERDLRELLPEDIKPAASMRAEDYLLQRPGT
ncbi:AAA family ATPase [Kribbella monticola]|uniref:AAA family ATPase n=1 Tax=Kribbella monticola TaxID=2185285 RepID=UPI000DD3347D|nr:AAA family ATPase [Kribbella monticola]